MNDPLYQRLRESGWRGGLTQTEEAELRAWLAAHPDLAADWETESGLNRMLERMPDAPVPSNFTANVLKAIERETMPRSQSRRWSWNWQFLLPRAAAAAVVVCLGVFSYEQRVSVQRAELARSVAAISNVAALSNPEVLQDFEAIRRLGQTPPADEELLALLK
jgi:anti-sigma factor RsiW